MYTLLEDDDVHNGGALGVSNSSVSESKTRDSKRKRFRKKTELQDDEDDEVVAPRKDDRRVKRRTAQAEDDSGSEEERLRDQREREILEEHLRERDAAGTRKAGEFFQSALSSAEARQREIGSAQTGEESLETPLLEEQEMTTDQSKQVKLGFISGLVPKAKSMSFERILFRATRGNVYLKQAVVEHPVTDPVSGEKVEKNVFAVFFSGEKAKNKILKICEAFGANRYSFSEDISKQAQMITEVSGRIAELKTTIDIGSLQRDNLLQTIGEGA